MKARSLGVGSASGGGGRLALQIGWFQDRAHAGRDGRARLHPGTEPADGGHGHGLGVLEDGACGLHAQRRVEGDRHRAQTEAAEERIEELRAGRKDEADVLAALHAGGREPGGVAGATLPQTPVRDGLVEDVEVLRVG